MSSVSIIYAHPDDETFLSACLIRQLADSGHPPALLLATRGDAGKKNGAFGHLSNEQLGELREREMSRAAAVIGLSEVVQLGYPDGKLAAVEENEAVKRVAEFINQCRSKAVFTFPEDGGNRHPDHMAISRITTKAVLSGQCPAVERLYYVMSDELRKEGHKPTLSIDTEPQWRMKAEALRAHESQILAIERYFGKLDVFPENRKYESFILAWEQGTFWPGKSEAKAREELHLPSV
ncbi:PIG-L deacetylase family protein [Paenibacillus allorhizosphaerae]|uniref:N-acetyl-alpha-D-glucosaminyl L-malate deacetylase 2 n=1 Tax=Paenibacillus allorhizosphaerae TaxID=2849866 RepID=A0ABN7TPR2_9BACL|nr:PIG-L deacetylase family protein [Paenibacillus allorhizosphaerae]CAG7645080.1 putative N-acetyl-alpha-D-glucosaminyl L-malate deacetylase 2 [Paenibacillus allorhizosphaerae]